ncbi:MAG: zf-TFIIB domain-containing protein [Candidatus Woesebacteria bacterium]|jgi:Zn-finger nucleic acid-binding protein
MKILFYEMSNNATLQMTSRESVEIDYYPECRGIWLDRGELDKIIDRSGSQSQNNPQQQQSHDSRNDDHKHDDYNKKHKKESFLGDLFDF